MRIPLTPVRCLTRAADLFSEKIGVVCGEKRFTYREFDERCRRLSSALRGAGVEPGDRVAYLSYNTHQLLEGYYGAPIIRAIVMPLNVRLTRPELTAIVAHAEPKILFYETEFASTVSLLRAGSPSLRIINLDTEYEDFVGQGHPVPIDITSYDEDAIAELFYTSGSTGTPKGVMLSHRTLYLHALNSVGSMDLNHHGVELHTIPLFHANGWGRPQTATMMGIKQIMVRRFECPTVCRLIQDERATSLSIVPTMANALLAFEQRADFDLSSLEQVFIGGAASSPALIRNLEHAFRCEILAGYGLTETSPVATSARRKSTVFYTSDEDRWERQSYPGWPIFGAEVRVVDAGMQPVPQDFSTVGEIVIRGDMVMDGYYREPEATAAAITGGWLHTGDMAVWDQENYIQIVDRKKDIIISGGENISSIEIEKAIALHPSVAEAAVVSAPDDKWGEIPVAFVVTKPGCVLLESELGAWLTARLARFKIPRRYVIQPDALPKGGTGKILKKDLREPFWRERQRRVQG
ncbi:MAG TPA: long-chain-fatty-acid--CoA ligase [Bryobacteraceae bacterium]|nr:long-chain-fatty-acid--CoA ligase [Bryobacteraceae bacterium]